MKQTDTCKELRKFKPVESEEQRLPTPLFGNKDYFCYFFYYDLELSVTGQGALGRCSGILLSTRGSRKELPGDHAPAKGHVEAADGGL